MNFRRTFTLVGLGLPLVTSLITTAACGRRFERPALPAFIAKAAKDTRVGYTLDAFSADLKDYNASSDLAARRKLRDKMTFGLMGEIDYAYYEYQSRLFVDHGTFGVASDFVSLGLAAGGTITNGSRAKTVLATLLSGTTGVNLSIDKNFFRQQTVQAILSSMDGNRDSLKATIIQQLSQNDDDHYSFLATRSDLIRYFYAGTLSSGLQQIHQQSAAAATNGMDNLNGVRSNLSHPERMVIVPNNRTTNDPAK